MAREKRLPRCMNNNKNNDVVVFKIQKTDNFGEKRKTLEVMDQS